MAHKRKDDDSTFIDRHPGLCFALALLILWLLGDLVSALRSAGA